MQVREPEASSRDTAAGWWLERHDSLPCMALLERDGAIFTANQAARGRLAIGDGVLACEVLGQELDELLRRRLDTETRNFEWRGVGRDGAGVVASGVMQAIVHEGEEYRLILLIERVQEALVVGEDHNLMQDLLEATEEALVIMSSGRVEYVNDAFARLFGYTLAECEGQDLAELTLPEGRLHEVEILDHMLMRSRSVSMESKARTRWGEEIDVVMDVTQTRQHGRKGQNVLVRYRDIRQQKREEARLQHTALHDNLTGLPNRVLFLERLRLTLSRLRRRPDRNFVIMFLDLDGFKQVNDTMGHAAGDALLVVVKDRLLACLRPQDTVARFGGDEFALLLDETGSTVDAATVAERLQMEVQRPVRFDGNEARVSLSIGIAMGSTTYDSAEQMMHDADMAMYQAKTSGKARHVVFEGRHEG